jgi:predicted RNA binding protein YcfA (HicA-like mRNA interferase family)
MKRPRNVDAADLIRALQPFGYEVTRQTGSHIRITTEQNGQHHEVVPNHSPLKIGTLTAILRNIARHHGLTVADLLNQLDL